ncbi:NADH-quinone oxidoreductase subunit L [Idiomarina abyssalis]|uniref:NADH-quinone oxidoreductase subunit L n=1 Tax=Idiomarina abyssalis TaxID=86102 RepID=UPI003A913F36
MTEWLTLSGVRPVLLALVALLALVVTRYAVTNFRLDPRRRSFVSKLVGCLVAVLVLIVSNHIVVFFVAWMSISLQLHRLLMFYPERDRAVLAAHKKFILARCSEAFLGTAFVLMYLNTGSFQLDTILKQFATAPTSIPQHIAAVCLVMAALIKCAQLPLHGWLIQVVEAPTPVSALLHAGIINLGGFLLLVTVPLWSNSVLAVWLLCLVSAASCCFAALIMATRISIKVRLAWSTCAQMGLMLLEIGLGYYDLALLHLVAHSVYKAHAFLSVSEVAVIKQPQARSILRVSLVFLIFQALIAATCWWLLGDPKWLPSALLAMALATIWMNLHQWLLRFAVSVLAIAAYLLLGALVQQVVEPQPPFNSLLLEPIITVLFNIFAFTYWLVHHTPSRRLSQRWFITLNAGLYLDEWLTRLVLWLWPSHPIRYYQRRSRQEGRL